MARGSLKTIGPTWGAKVDRLYEARWMKVLGIVGFVSAIPLALISIALSLD
jgi:hypothetical protein